MFRLLQLFFKLSGFFVFVLLEIICFTLVVKYNQSQQGVYLNTVSLGSGLFQKIKANSRYYFSLDDENYRLAKENARLLQKLYNKGIDTIGVQDTASQQDGGAQYTFTRAKIIKNSTNDHHNYIVLDVGSKDGVRPHTGVIANDGVVGIIRKVSRSYAVAMSVLHRQTRISARIRGRNFFGSLTWKEKEEDNNRMFRLEDIPKDAIVMIGDTVETSGYSAIFPEGILLGMVEDITLEPGKNYYSIDVKSKLDMNNIQYVYVVNNLLKKELEELEAAVRAEDE